MLAQSQQHAVVAKVVSQSVNQPTSQSTSTECFPHSVIPSVSQSVSRCYKKDRATRTNMLPPTEAGSSTMACCKIIFLWPNTHRSCTLTLPTPQRSGCLKELTPQQQAKHNSINTAGIKLELFVQCRHNTARTPHTPAVAGLLCFAKKPTTLLLSSCSTHTWRRILLLLNLKTALPPTASLPTRRRHTKARVG